MALKLKKKKINILITSFINFDVKKIHIIFVDKVNYFVVQGVVLLPTFRRLSLTAPSVVTKLELKMPSATNGETFGEAPLLGPRQNNLENSLQVNKA